MKSRAKKLIGLLASIVLIGLLSLPVSANSEPASVVPNHSFENGNSDGWESLVRAVNPETTYFSVSSEKSYDGQYSLKGVDPSGTDSVAIKSPLVEIIPGESYKGSVQMWNPSDGRASVLIRYYDENQQPVGSNDLVTHQQTKGSWILTEVDGKVAPANAKYIAIVASISLAWTTSGTYWDDFKLIGNFPESPAVGEYSFSGEEFTNVDTSYELTLRASNNADLYSIIADVEYDARYLDFVTAEGVGSFANSVVTVDDSTAGKVSVVATLTGTEGVNQDTDVIKFTFMPTGTGAADVSLLTTTITAKVNGDTTGKTFSPTSSVVHTVIVVESNFDVNGDGEINLIDLTTVAYYVGTDADATTSKYDMNLDGKIDIEDLGVLANIIHNQ